METARNSTTAPPKANRKLKAPVFGVASFFPLVEELPPDGGFWLGCDPLGVWLG